jgi:hypothetical protein
MAVSTELQRMVFAINTEVLRYREIKKLASYRSSYCRLILRVLCLLAQFALAPAQETRRGRHLQRLQ